MTVANRVPILTRVRKLLQRAICFVQQQTDNFKLMLWRRTLHAVASSLCLQYNSIYATLLGANSTQLGALRSVGNAIGALAALPAGWFIDYYSLRPVLLLSTLMLAASSMLYFAAPHWTWLYAAVTLYYLGLRITCTSCTVTCAEELPDEERATGRGFCQTLSSIAKIATPPLAAWVISVSGDLGLSGIRPLYVIQALIFLTIFLLLLTQLRGLPVVRASGDGILFSVAQVFKQGADVVRLLLVMGLMEIPWSLTEPFMPVYAYQFKGADEFMLSGIQMAITVVPVLISIPLGRMADRYGRKRLLFAVAPLAYVGNLCLVFAPAKGPLTCPLLLLYGVMFGFNSISMALVSSMTAEIMSEELMGRWIGIVILFRGLVSIPAPLIGGLIWERVGPRHVFLAAIAIDAILRLPLLGLTQETRRPSSAGS